MCHLFLPTIDLLVPTLAMIKRFIARWLESSEVMVYFL